MPEHVAQALPQLVQQRAPHCLVLLDVLALAARDSGLRPLAALRVRRVRCRSGHLPGLVQEKGAAVVPGSR